MKTVKDVSLLLNVSQVTVYNHLKKLDKEITPNVFKKKGTTYINDEGINQLKISLGLMQVPQVKENVSIENIIDEISNIVSERVADNIKTNYNDLQTQIEELKAQNERLIELIERNQRLTIIERVQAFFKG